MADFWFKLKWIGIFIDKNAKSQTDSLKIIKFIEGKQWEENFVLDLKRWVLHSVRSDEDELEKLKLAAYLPLGSIQLESLEWSFLSWNHGAIRNDFSRWD